MIGMDAVMRLIGGVQEAELRHWIEERWVRPEPASEGYVFREVDVARVRLIVELRRELAIDEEALPVVLQLLDRLIPLPPRRPPRTEPLTARHPPGAEAGGARLRRFPAAAAARVPQFWLARTSY